MSRISVKEPVITLSAGPVACYPRVQRAMARPVYYDFDSYFQEFYERTVLKLTEALRDSRTISRARS